MLPAAIVRQRSQQLAQVRASQQQQQAQEMTQKAIRGATRMMWIVIVSIMLPLVIIIGVFVRIGVLAARAPDIPQTTSLPTTHVEMPAPPPKPRASDAASTGQTRTASLMKDLDSKGCKKVMMVPAQRTGDASLTSDMVMNGLCLRLLVISGVPDNKLTITMKNPFSESIEVPNASNEINFQYCPKRAGPHPITVAPATDDFYTVAALECPKAVK
jgi:hypothetical protein